MLTLARAKNNKATAPRRKNHVAQPSRSISEGKLAPNSLSDASIERVERNGRRIPVPWMSLCRTDHSDLTIRMKETSKGPSWARPITARPKLRTFEAGSSFAPLSTCFCILGSQCKTDETLFWVFFHQRSGRQRDEASGTARELSKVLADKTSWYGLQPRRAEHENLFFADQGCCAWISGSLEIEARFGLKQDRHGFNAGLSQADFTRLVHLLQSDSRIHATSNHEEINYNYSKDGHTERIVEAQGKPLRRESKNKFTQEHFDSLSTQVGYTLRVTGASEIDLGETAEIPPGWEMKRRKTRQEFSLKPGSWSIHATEVAALSGQSTAQNSVFEVELELPLVDAGLTEADTERQLNELNEGISFLLHLLICGREGRSALSWTPPPPLTLEAPRRATVEAQPGDYVPHPNLHPDSYYQRSPNGTYRSAGPHHQQGDSERPQGAAEDATQQQQPGHSAPSSSSDGAAPAAAPYAGYNNGQYDGYDAEPSYGYGYADVQHHYHVGSDTADFHTIRLDVVRDPPTLKRLREVLDSCKPKGVGPKNADFWGTMPISFSRRYLDTVLKEDYHVSEKTDGVRYLMLISAECGGMFFVNRSGVFFAVYEFNQVPGFAQFFNNTLLDGELVIHQKTQHPYFLLFDCVRYQSDSVAHMPLDGRLQMIGKFVVAFRQQFPDTRFHPFGILGKTVTPKSHLNSIVGNISMDTAGRRVYMEGDGQKRCHLTDGLIFTPSRLPYHFGTCHTMFKWKYVELLSIDFALRFENPPDPHRYQNNPDPRFRKVELSINMNQGKPSRCKTTELLQYDYERLLYDLAAHNMNPRSERIIAEMAFEPRDSSWRYHRLRVDKKNPNHISIAFDTMEAIAENLTLEDIQTHLGPKKP